MLQAVKCLTILRSAPSLPPLLSFPILPFSSPATLPGGNSHRRIRMRSPIEPYAYAAPFPSPYHPLLPFFSSWSSCCYRLLSNRLPHRRKTWKQMGTEGQDQDVLSTLNRGGGLTNLRETVDKTLG
mmetsp:Transcript_19301/g.29238  ORF Transcript_19301/g.29238 Transcript_19301/m.29238 type:complete len:126 (+) Transcript_19301:772-1149(+)